LKVKILIMEDRTYLFTVALPNTGFLLMFAKKYIFLQGFSKNIKKPVITLKNVVQLARFKFPHLSLQNSVPIIMGTVYSCNLSVSLVEVD
jgi:ribosomal protein L11